MGRHLGDADQHDVLDRFDLGAAPIGQRNLVPFVLGAEDMPNLGHARHGLAVDLGDDVVLFEPGPVRRGILLHRGHFRQCGVEVLAFHDDAQGSLVEVLALLEPRQHGEHVLQRHREADARIVPLETRGHAFDERRCGNDDTLDAALDVRQRPAVVDGRNLGIGLDRLAPDAILGTEDA